MGLMILADATASGVLLLLLAASLALTWWETHELELDWRTTAWWMLAVALVHVPGYLALRFWGWRRKQVVS